MEQRPFLWTFTAAKERQQKKQGTQEARHGRRPATFKEDLRKEIYVKKHLRETLETQKHPQKQKLYETQPSVKINSVTVVWSDNWLHSGSRIWAAASMGRLLIWPHQALSVGRTQAAMPMCSGKPVTWHSVPSPQIPLPWSGAQGAFFNWKMLSAQKGMIFKKENLTGDMKDRWK